MAERVSAEQIALMKRLFAGGLGVMEIAKEVGRARRTVAYCLKTTKQYGKPSTDEERAMRELYAAGVSIKDISRRMHRAEKTVSPIVSERSAAEVGKPKADTAEIMRSRMRTTPWPDGWSIEAPTIDQLRAGR